MEFVTAVVSLSIGKHNPLFINLNAEIVAANLNSDKVVDGIVKGITRTDIKKFASKLMEKVLAGANDVIMLTEGCAAKSMTTVS